MDLMINAPSFDDWIPFNLHWNHEQPVVDWCYLGDERFTAPFATETIDNCLRRPFNLLFRRQTPIQALDSFTSERPGLTPNGFIFHLSRSGSTLVSQMLAAVPKNIVISEARIVDLAIRSYRFLPTATETQRIGWLQQIISLLGRPRGPEENFILKFDAWSIVDFTLIRRAFPNVPWVFVYRDPLEVMVSQFSRRGAQMIPGALDPRGFGMDLQTAVSIPPEEYCARVLAAVCKAALDHHRMRGRLINYTELPKVVSEDVLNYFGLVHSESELALLRAASQRYSKDPWIHFQQDTEEKRQKVTAAMRDAANQWLYPVYKELERARLAQSDLT